MEIPWELIATGFVVAAIFFGSIGVSKENDEAGRERPWFIAAATCGGFSILAGVGAAL